ncbi:histone H1-like [Zeugodacus cucurbitae]|uniref:Histone H1-I n=1 Tax=Zeugodacus cucurbitae TaxID=28588 RepID=A0A0A1WUX8_ZEUCU|nr:histone H1-like [Zeugodacus cucurbitae]
MKPFQTLLDLHEIEDLLSFCIASIVISKFIGFCLFCREQEIYCKNMKLFVCSSVETSDDDEEEEVSEEEPQVDSDEGDSEDEDEDEDEGDSDESNADEHDSDNTGDEKGSGTKNTGKQINKNSVDSEASSSSEAETSFKGVNGEQKVNGIKQEQPVKAPEFNVSKSPSKSVKSVSNGVSLPARLKNVSTEIMVLTAIRSLSDRGGSSVIAIKKYIMNNYPQLEGPRTLKLIKTYIKKALVSGKLVQSKGTGLGGSFKVSPGTNRLEEQKQRETRKKLAKKPKSDEATDKVKKNSKAATKNIEKGEVKTTKTTKSEKAKISRSALKDEKMAKLAIALKKALEASELKPEKKAAKVKEAKEASPANGNPAKKTKVAKQNGMENGDSATKKTNKKNKPAPAVTIQEKMKPAMATKKKATAKSKTIVQDIDMGAGDADDAKPKKKTAGKKVKAK